MPPRCQGRDERGAITHPGLSGPGEVSVVRLRFRYFATAFVVGGARGSRYERSEDAEATRTGLLRNEKANARRPRSATSPAVRRSPARITLAGRANVCARYARPAPAASVGAACLLTRPVRSVARSAQPPGPLSRPVCSVVLPAQSSWPTASRTTAIANP